MDKKKKKKRFIFFRGIGKLLFFKRHSNLFFVLLDSKSRHVVTLTSGFCEIGKNKKQKISPLNMGKIIEKLKTYIALYNIKSLDLFIRQRIIYFLRKLRKLLNFYNIIISNYSFILNKPHGYIRGRTPRRV